MADPPARDRSSLPWGRAIGFIGLVAAPLYLWAQATEPGIGLQRPMVRNGLRSAPILGLVAFSVTTVLSARWRLRSGGRRERHGDGPE